MAAATYLRGVMATSTTCRTGTSRFAHRLGQSNKIVAARPCWLVVDSEAHNLPTTRRGEASRVRGAQVVTVRLGVGREWTDHGRGVCVDIRERGDSWLGARGTGAASKRAHVGED